MNNGLNPNPQPNPFLAGSTGRSSTTDTSQWVNVETEPDLHVSPHVTPNTCSEIVSHVTYKVFYTEVGEEGNPQSVVTAVKIQHSTQGEKEGGGLKEGGSEKERGGVG